MASYNFFKISIVITISCLLTTCKRYFPGSIIRTDIADKGLTIFSNTNNNVMSCYLQNKPWISVFRGNIYPISDTVRHYYFYEFKINKIVTNSPNDTLTFNWYGIYNNDSTHLDTISVWIPIQKNFTIDNLLEYNGRRLSLDGTNGLFTLNSNITAKRTIKGIGNIYFHSIKYDSTLSYRQGTSLSGLIDAKFDTIIISRGRFDHRLEPFQINL